MTRSAVRELTVELVHGDPTVVERVVRFICSDTRGLWHGRGRAKMCRRLKHIQLPRSSRTRLTDVILTRLKTGDFAEQFKDQLKLSLFLDRKKTLSAGEIALNSDKDYVRRYAQWLISLAEKQDAA